MAKYEAVTREQLRQRLGGQCSPMQGRDGYVIGPDIHGRICHCSTHFSLGEAQRKAKELNDPARDKFKQIADQVGENS